MSRNVQTVEAYLGFPDARTGVVPIVLSGAAVSGRRTPFRTVVALRRNR
jgi:hypothetical protein